MQSDLLFTEYAPAERSEQNEILRQAEYFAGNPLLDSVTGTVNDFVLVLNSNRQAVFVNDLLAEYLGKSKEELLGQRPGEMLGCIHARNSMCGCGTTKFCITCGAVNAIISSLEGRTNTQECHIQQADSGDSLNLRVKTTPFEINGDFFIISAFSDISNEKRRRALERIFFHDLLNIACGLSSVAELINMDKSPGLEKYKARLLALTDRFVDEIESQRDLNAAESNELMVSPEVINSLQFLSDIAEICRSFALPGSRSVKITDNTASIYFISDRVLLSRVIVNLIKNAMEATTPGLDVTISLRQEEDNILFRIHNPSSIPDNIQSQIFQRSFTTKGTGRGLGTYSARLLSERYLKGKITFFSSEETGTIFTAEFPLRLN